MSSSLLILPLLIPTLTAGLAMTAWSKKRLQQIVSVTGSAALAVAGVALLAAVWKHGTLVVSVGGWPAPFGITLVADHISAIMLAVTGIIGFAVTVYAQASFDGTLESPAFQPIFQSLLLGVCGSFLTGDIFNLYVWFEVMLLSSFVLLALTRTRPAMEGALKYVTLNLISSAIFLSTTGVLYAICHSLNMADLSVRLELLQRQHPDIVLAMGLMFLVGFGIKSGLFPLNFWLPASYHTPAAAVSAIFAGLLTKVGVYALFRTFLTIFPYDERYLTVILILAGLTMITGVLGAVSQFEIRRILSFHIISQIGYIVVGLGLATAASGPARELAVAAAIFYTVHHIIVKTNLFLVGGVIRARQGSYDLKDLGGLAKRAPWLAVLFLIPALSLAGIPPLSGFWAKMALLKASLQAGAYVIVAVAIAAGLLTLLSMIKIWNEAFWKEPDRSLPATKLGARQRLCLFAPIVALASMTVFIGIRPGALYVVAERAAADLLDRERYVRAVSPLSQPSFVSGDEVGKARP